VARATLDGVIGQDPRHLEAVVLDHQRLARHLARRYSRGDRDLLEELEQVAMLGLVQAARRFDMARGNAFSTFAVPTILGELRRYLRSDRWVAHVPRGLQERVLRAREVERALTARTGRPPGTEQLAGELGWPVEELLDVLIAAGALSPVSLDAPSGDDADAPLLGDRIGEEDAALWLCELRDELEHALAALDPCARKAIYLRYEQGLSMREIAERIGTSAGHASRLLGRALHQLKPLMTRGDFDATVGPRLTA
jgi:RNA polymerase sigma-B factor